MASVIEGKFRTFKAAAAIPAHSLVKIDGANEDQVAVCALDEGNLAIGVTEDEAFAAADLIPVRMLGAGGTVKVIASQAITLNSSCYAAAAGEVSDVAGAGIAVGVAMSAASAQGSLFEMLIKHVL